MKIEDKFINVHKCSTVYIILFSLSFAINIGVATYLAYYKYMNHNKENVFKNDCTY